MSSGKEKSGYARIDSVSNSRVSSPSSTIPTDDHFAYSTSLRRHEPEMLINSTFSNSNNPYPHPTAYNPNSTMHSPPFHGNNYSSHPFAHTTSPLTPSAHYATLDVQSTISALSTDPVTGLNSAKIPAIRELSGPNEFEVAAKDPLWKRFAGQFYGEPLILLLLGSAVVSALVGNYDDGASILAAIIIVVTGTLLECAHLFDRRKLIDSS